MSFRAILFRREVPECRPFHDLRSVPKAGDTKGKIQAVLSARVES
jgi:hypothetical protein